VFSAFGEAVR